MAGSSASTSCPEFATAALPAGLRRRCATIGSGRRVLPPAPRCPAPPPSPFSSSHPWRLMAASLFVRKSIQDCERDIRERGGLSRSLTKWHLTALGVGATIGAGIFATTGTAIVGDAARPGAGPAIIFSFILTAVACGFAALCYAEFAAMVPISGSAYTYAYASIGEFVAWIIGWDLIIEYAVGNIGVAIGWAGYFRELINHFGLDLPPWLATDYRSAHDAFTAVGAAAAGATDATTQYIAAAWTTAPHLVGFPIIMNLPAVAVVAVITI